MLAATAIFEGGQSTFALPSTGRSVTVKAAKMKQLTAVMKFVQQVAEALSVEQLTTMIDLIASKQKALILEGTDPAKVNLREIAQSDEIVKGAFGNVSIISLLLQATSEQLPAFAAVFSDVTEAEYEELDFDDGILLVLAIFMLNYGFFTQRLLPMLMGFVRSLASENLKKRNQVAKELVKAPR